MSWYSRRTGAARRASGPDRRGQGSDRGAGPGALGARAGRPCREDDRARAKREANRQEAGRPAARSAGAGPGSHGPGQTDGCPVAHHAAAGDGFEQTYNAQAAVACGSMLVVTNDVVQAGNDKEQIAPTLEKIDRLPEALGEAETLLADSGYFSEANVTACANASITPLIAPGRERHHLLEGAFRGRPAGPGLSDAARRDAA
jgi:hypothetical protein